MKLLDFLRKSTPENPSLGYGDSVSVFENFEEKYISHCSTCPNPYNPKTMESWTTCYAMIAEIETYGECIEHKHYGKCILLNEGKELFTINPNVNHGGRYVADQVFIHCGGRGSENHNWRGSVACITIPIENWTEFMNNFSIGERVKIQIRRDGVV